MNDNEHKTGTAEATASAATGTRISAEEMYFEHLKRDPTAWNSMLRIACNMLRNAGNNDEAVDYVEHVLVSMFDEEDERDGFSLRKEDVSLRYVAKMILEFACNDPAARFKAYLLDCCRDETVAMVARETDDTIRRIALDLKRKYNAILSVTGTEPEEIDFESVAYDVLAETVKLAKADQTGARAAAEEEEDGDETDSEYNAAGRAYTEWLAHQPERMAALVETVHAGLQEGVADGQIAWMLAHKMKAGFEEHVLEIEAETDGDLSDLDAALVGMDSNEIDFYQIALETVRIARDAMTAAEDGGEEDV